jgi:hypothetical protein
MIPMQAILFNSLHGKGFRWLLLGACTALLAEMLLSTAG